MVGQPEDELFLVWRCVACKKELSVDVLAEGRQSAEALEKQILLLGWRKSMETGAIYRVFYVFLLDLYQATVMRECNGRNINCVRSHSRQIRWYLLHIPRHARVSCRRLKLMFHP